MKVLVTGAAGFIGAALLEKLAARDDISHILAVDQDAPAYRHAKVEARAANLADAPMARSLVDRGVDAIFHLASLVSGGAERNFELGMKVNFDATRDLLEAARLGGNTPRFVFTSSIAVYHGEKLEVTDATAAKPRLSYGVQKLMCEILIEDYARRGFVDGRSLRLPTVLVRPGASNSAVSGWASAIIREPLMRRDYLCPVSPETHMACISVERVVEALLHALDLSAADLGLERSLVLTGIPVSAQAMLDAVRRAAGDRPLGRVRFVSDPAAQAVMDRVPRSTLSARAAALGFRHSAGIAEIVAEYLQESRA